MEKSVLDVAAILNNNKDLPPELRERIENFIQRLRERRSALSSIDTER